MQPTLFDSQLIESLRGLLHELSARYEVNTTSLRSSSRPRIRGANDVAALFRSEMQDLAQEQLRVLLLDTKNAVIGVRVIYQGNVNSSMIRPAEVLRPAIVESATAFIMVHNHPSGVPTPSAQDVEVTRNIKKAASLMEIELLDHIIIGRPGHVSIKDAGLWKEVPHGPARSDTEHLFR